MKDHSWRIGMPKTKASWDKRTAELDKEADRLRMWAKTGKEPPKGGRADA
jgi:hypothetical protein